ncbi:YonK family protein [Streptomyces sp. NPDC057927]
MAKRTSAVNIKGELNLEDMTLTEITKDAENVYDFLEILSEHDGKIVTFSIKEENELPIKEEV